MKLYIRTKYGDAYHIAENGDITRLDQPGLPSGQWKLLGIKHVRRSEFIPLEKLFNGFSRLAPGTPEHTKLMFFKNGNPQWTVRDLDHGAVREWGNTKYHGIEDIRLLP